MRVFISYATEDRHLAEQVHFALVGAGYDTFFDKESLPPGDDFHSRISAAIAKSDAFVFLIGPHSVSNGSYALTELRHAKNKWRHPKGSVLPVLASKVDWEAIPNYLRAVTVLEPEGNVPAEVVIAISNLKGKHKAVQDRESEVSSDRPVNGKSGVDKPTKITVPLIVAVIGVAGTLGAAIIANWDNLFTGPDSPPVIDRDLDSTPLTSAAKEKKASVGNSNPPSEVKVTYSLPDLWCVPLPGKNPILSRAAELSPPDYTIDVNRHLLINKSGQPVSVVPAASLGTLDKLRFIVVHFSAGTATGAESFFQQPEAGASVHVMIARDGTVRQLVPFDYAAHHVGVGTWKGSTGLNRFSVGITLENWGQLQRKNDAWLDPSGREVPVSEVVPAVDWQTGWHKYTDAQIRSFFFVACALRKAYPSIEEIVGHEQISPGRKNDPGPAFPLDEMQRRLLAGIRQETLVESRR